jgi:hypothetical protein
MFLHVQYAPIGLSSRPAEICAKHSNWTESQCAQVAQGQVLIGMTDEMVHAVWGAPKQVNTTYTAGHISDIRAQEGNFAVSDSHTRRAEPAFMICRAEVVELLPVRRWPKSLLDAHR